jgi:hypothetical protein
MAQDATEGTSSMARGNYKDYTKISVGKENRWYMRHRQNCSITLKYALVKHMEDVISPETNDQLL